MAVEVGGLVAKFEADTSGLQRGAQEAKGALADVGQQAQRTADDIDATAARMAKSLGGTAAEWRDILGRTGFQQVGEQAAKVADSIQQVGATSKKAADEVKASAETITKALQGVGVNPAADRLEAILSAQARAEQQSGIQRALQSAGVSSNVARRQAGALADGTTSNPAAQRAQQAGAGGSLSDSDLVRFGAGIVGVGLGLSLVAGAARLIHEQIVAIIDRQTEWERGLVAVRGIYGDVGNRLVEISQAQSQAPGLLGSQSEFLQANLSASYLGRRYGVSQGAYTSLVSAGGAASYALDLAEPDRRRLQASLLGFAESGSGDLRELGADLDPERVARRIGLPSQAGLQALTPAQLVQIRTQLGVEAASSLALNGDQANVGLLDARRRLEQQQLQAQSSVQSFLETVGRNPGEGGIVPEGGGYGAAARQAQVAQAAEDLTKKLAENAQQIGDNTKRLQEARDALSKLGVEANSATAHLMSFAGSLEDPTSIARLDLAAQAQASVAARTRMAVPSIGTTQGEIVAGATNNAYQAAYQNYVAQQAQNEQRNAIREELERRVQFGPAAQRPAAARALEQASASEPVYQRLGEAQRASSLVDMRSAETQAGLQQITLTQQERGIQLLRETIDLRRLDVEQQRTGVQVQMDVIRVQQQGLGAQYSLADANYAQQRTQALARQYIGRSLRGQSTAGLPSINDLIQQNVNSQFDIAERTPAALEAQHRVDIAQRTATSIGLGQQLTEGQLQYAQLGTDLKNLGDLPSQTALMLQDIQNGRDQLDVAKDIRELQKDLVKIFTGHGGQSQSGSSQALDELINRVALELLGDDSAGGNTAPPDLPANRRGPY